ncbi:hypothetical protein CAEBREN_03784 [Caenorhabditis brenneri]|uniref:Chromo shadow domain-containing protein n=1 Tax=Caenorhabditis brenneri TaxID=135651 RepID=G0NQW2_CAEBE|nr:hypothetical protein CAEBREN_03784 [Caenorhabditis brenneri]
MKKLRRSATKYHLAAEILKWWRHRATVEGSEPGSAIPDSQKMLWRRRRPRRRLQVRPSAPPLTADEEGIWSSGHAGEDYLIGRKIVRIHGTKRIVLRRNSKLCFLCQFKDKTQKFIVRELVNKHDPHAVIRYYEDNIAAMKTTTLIR